MKMKEIRQVKIKSIPELREQRSKDLESVLDWMLAEVQSCDDGVCPEERGTFLALAAVLDTELRLRNPRRKPRVVTE